MKLSRVLGVGSGWTEVSKGPCMFPLCEPNDEYESREDGDKDDD